MAERYYCPVCRSPRKASLRDTLSMSMHLRMAVLTSALVLFALALKGPELAIKTAFVYLPIWAVFEFYHWHTMRKLSACKFCGFDPILYQKDWRQARALVEARLEQLKVQRLQQSAPVENVTLSVEPTKESIRETKAQGPSAVRNL